MANKTLFRTVVGALIPRVDARNEAGGPAYTLPPQHALAQYAATGCLNSTFYANAQDQLTRVIELCREVDAHPSGEGNGVSGNPYRRHKGT